MEGVAQEVRSAAVLVLEKQLAFGQYKLFLSVLYKGLAVAAYLAT